MIRILALLLCLPTMAWATYSLPSDRNIDFSNAGIPGGIPSRPAAGRTTLYVNDYGAVVNDGNSDNTAIAAAITAASAGDVVEFGSGTYNISSTIALKNGVTLRGQGNTTVISTSSTSLLTMMSADNGITSASYSIQAPITSGATKGSTSLTLNSGDADYTSFAAGDIIVVGMSNTGVPWINQGGCTWDIITNQIDSTLVNYAQLVEVQSRNSNVITISPAIMVDMSGYSPFVAKASTAYYQYVGVEDMKLTRTGYPSSQGTMISYNGCKWSWVKGVEISYGWGRMIDFGRVWRSEMFKNYVHHGGTYTSGALNYHLVIRRYSGSNLIHSNVSCYTNKSMQIESTGGGNVIAYNYFDGSWVDETNPYWQGQDIGTHCAHPHHELVEGNVFNRFNNDNIHGSASHFIVFRNHIDSDHAYFCEPSHPYDDTNSVAAVAQDNGYYLSAIGNILGKSGRTNLFECNPSTSCSTGPGNNYVYMFRTSDNTPPSPYSTILRHANYDYYNNAQVQNGIDDLSLPDSLYLTGKPAYFGSLTWPPIDPSAPSVATIPAVQFYNTGSWPSESDDPPSLSTKTIASNGTTLTLTFSESVTFGSGGNGGWTISASGGAATVSYSSGSGSSSLVYTISRTIVSGETVTISYTQPGNGVEDSTGNDLATLSNAAVTNYSTYINVGRVNSSTKISGGTFR